MHVCMHAHTQIPIAHMSEAASTCDACCDVSAHTLAAKTYNAHGAAPVNGAENA